MSSRPSPFWLWVIAVAAVLVLVIVIFPLKICTDRAFVDETTGSRRGYREWFFGAHSGSWYKQSGLETFLRTNRPGSIQPRWTSYAGTGRNVLGAKVSFGHGRPGAILMLGPEDLTEYCRRASDVDKRSLHDTLLGGDQPKIRETASRILEVLWKDEGARAGPGGPADGSQPSGSETNRTPVAAGSRR